jgi:hypothetical protein
MRIAILLLLSLVSLMGQIRSARISGNVSDPSGAPIPDAKVEVKETRTNQAYAVATNESGEFAVPYLPPGEYQVSAGKTGFSLFTQKGLELATGQQLRVEVQLKVQSVEGKIEVTAETVNIQTENATVQGVTGEKVIQAVPNVNHNPLYYVTLQMGATPRASMSQTSGQNSFGVGINGRRQFSAVAVNGGGAFQNDFQVDGVSVVGSAWNEAAVLPNTDGLQEVRTTVNNYSAEYGRGQGVISMTTKSGTNEFHGSAFWRHRNDGFNANSFGNNARGITRPSGKVHTYGATFGGPVKKDKAFFFASWEGLKFNEGLVFLRTVPTVREKAGDFSQTFANVGGVPTPLQLFDPYTVNNTGNNVWTRTPIPNSIIPASRLNTAALGLLRNYPDPNRTPDQAAFNINNYQNGGLRVYGRNNLNSRFDYRLSDRQSLYFTGGFTYGDITNSLTWGGSNLFNSAAGEQFAPFITDRNPYISVGDTFVVSPTFVIDVRYGLNRIRTGSLANDTPDFDYRGAGIPADIEAAMATRRLPNFFVDGNAYWSVLNNNAYMHKDERQTNHVLAGSGTKIAGKWTLKFGGEGRLLYSNYTDAQESISYRLNSSFTSGANVNATGGIVGTVNANQLGHSYASFLLGAGQLEIGRGFNAKPAFLQEYYALYSQNDWRPTNRLTLNFGLRWDLQPGVSDRYNRISSFDISATNPFGTRGAFYFPGATGEDRHMWETDWKNFGPRFGAAYRLKENFVLRGGYGITFLPSNTGFFNGPFNYGMQSFAPNTDAQPFGLNPAGVTVGSFSTNTRLVQPTGADPRAAALYGNPSPRFDRINSPTPYVQQANFFMEYKKSNWLFALGWSGAYGRRLALSRLAINSDQFLQDSTLANWRTDYIARNGTGHLGSDQIANPFQPATGARIPFLGNLGNASMPRNQTLWPYPHFGGMAMSQIGGFSDYNALQFQVTRNLTKGLLFNAHYTWSRALEVANAEAQNNFGAEGFGSQAGNLRDQRQNRRLSSNDIPHRTVMTIVYELPFGKGRSFDLKNSVANFIAGGWQVSGVYMYQSGTPLIIGGANTNSLNGRPDRVAGQPLVLPENLQGWYNGTTPVTLPSGRTITPPAFSFLKYNPDAFVGRVVPVANGSIQRELFWWGNAAFTYNELRNNAMNNWTMSVQRNFQLRERLQLQLQAHAQNLFNHTQFSPGWTTGLGGTEILNNPSRGQLPGYGQAAGFGTRGTATFDARNLEIVLKLRF